MKIKENPLIPMGAITGKPSKEFLTETLEAYREKGITQFMIYPRTGCELEYLGDEWFATCKHILEEAERLKFTSIWIYDEYNWPSGTCNKRVPQKNPDFAMKQLCVCQKNGQYEFAVRRNPNMTDLMNSEAVDCFIAMTYEQYARRFGRYMGNLIKGFFTDEPDIAYFSFDNEEDILRLPYYDGIENDYKTKTGSDLFGDIRSGLENQSEFYQHTCNQLCAEKFRVNFAERISSWCAKYNMMLTGHLMNEYHPASALRSNGHPLRVLDAFSLPGMDEIYTNKTIGSIEWLTFGTVMHAVEQRGNKGGLAELFALGPCDLTPAQIRRQLWMAAMFGINRYVMAVSQLDHRGNAEKKLYFNPFTRTQPWFQAYDVLGEEAKQAAGFATKEREYHIEVRYPYTPAPLTHILKYLTEKQYSWRLLDPAEEPTCDVVISPENSGIREERSNQFYFDIQSLEHRLFNNMELRPVLITEHNGELAQNLFIRCFKDGTCAIIDFSGKNRKLCLNRKGRSSDFILPAEGVVTFPGWKVELDRPNTLRIDFVDKKFIFTLSEPCSNLRLAVRNYAGKPELLLDGVPLEATHPAVGLPQGFREIYLGSDCLNLAAGEHVLEQKNDLEDFPFLPTAWIFGEFAVSQDGIIGPYLHDGIGLSGYAGTISQQAEIAIPVNAQKISIDPQGLTSELKIDGTSLGKRLWEPFSWTVPDKLRGANVKIELLRYTSCGRIFGENIRDRVSRAPDNVSAIRPFCELAWE